MSALGGETMDAITTTESPASVGAEIASVLKQKLPCLNHDEARIGLVLGSGLHGVADQIQDNQRIAYGELPGLWETTAVGHVGEFVAGKWNGFPVLAMNGRFHLYEGFSTSQVSLPLRAMQSVGIRHVVISNAAGGLNPRFQTGDVMLIDEQVDLTFRRETEPGNRRRTNIYDADWRSRFVSLAVETGLPIQRGTYVGLTGPTYETRAEYRFLRDHVGDAVGMSTVWEARIAANCGLHVFGISVITNVASADVAQNTSSAEVLEVAGKAESRVERWLNLILAAAPLTPRVPTVVPDC